MSDPAETLEQMLARVRAHEDCIFVRVERDGHWHSMPLSELSRAEWGEKVGKWARERVHLEAQEKQ